MTMQKWIFLLVVAGAFAIASALGLFDKAASCGDAVTSGKVFDGMRGGPHYFESVNHVCRPSQPEKPIADGRTPQTSDQPIYAAWFNEKGRVVKLQKFQKRGEADWLEETTYDRNDFLSSVERRTPGAPTIKEIYGAGIFLRVERDGRPVVAPGKPFGL